MPCSSPRSSGWRATDWIMEPKMFPMPMPAPSEPSPMPSASPIAFPAFVTSPDVAARSVCTSPPFIRCAGRAGTAFLVGIASDASVLRLDCRADVDGGQGGEDERLNPDHDHDLEDVEQGCGNQHGQECQRLEDEDQPEEGQDQDVSGEHVREESDTQRNQPHELAEDLEGNDEDQQSLRRFRDPALEVPDRAVPADSFDMGEREGQQR